MQELRRIIRKLILEVKELTPEELEQRKEMGYDVIPDFPRIKRDQRRVFGLQDPVEQEHDRNVMQQYHKELHSTPEGKKLIKQFQSGDGVTVWHSIGYDSVASRAGKKPRRGTFGRQQRGPHKDKPGHVYRWFRKFGKGKKKDQISACATSTSIGENIPNDVWGADNGGVVANGVGFILKGYPSIISVYDQMTQTLGSLSQSMVKHQRQSGVAKRTGDFDGLIIAPDFGFAGEVALDNWTVHGVYLNFGALDPDGDLGRYGGSSRVFLDVFWDALHTNLPVYIYHGTEFFGKYQGAKEEHLEAVYGPAREYYRRARRGQTKHVETSEFMETEEFDKTLIRPKLYLEKYPEAGKEDKTYDIKHEKHPRPSDPSQNPWLLYAAQKRAHERGDWEPDPANDWGDPANPDLPCTVDPSFDSWGDLYDAWFPGWRNWK